MQDIDREWTDREARRLAEETLMLEEVILDQLGLLLVGRDARSAMAAMLIIAGKLGRRAGVPPELWDWMTAESAAEYQALVLKSKRANEH